MLQQIEHFDDDVDPLVNRRSSSHEEVPEELPRLLEIGIAAMKHVAEEEGPLGFAAATLLKGLKRALADEQPGR